MKNESSDRRRERRSSAEIIGNLLKSPVSAPSFRAIDQSVENVVSDADSPNQTLSSSSSTHQSTSSSNKWVSDTSKSSKETLGSKFSIKPGNRSPGGSQAIKSMIHKVSLLDQVKRSVDRRLLTKLMRFHDNKPHLQWKDLSVEGLTYFGGRKKLLHSVAGRLAPHRLTCVMGPSGAGKSTLMNVLSGRVSSSMTLKVDGDIKFDNNVLNHLDLRDRIAYDFHQSQKLYYTN